MLKTILTYNLIHFKRTDKKLLITIIKSIIHDKKKNETYCKDIKNKKTNMNLTID